jgi:hypothetical protein
MGVIGRKSLNGTKKASLKKQGLEHSSECSEESVGEWQGGVKDVFKDLISQVNKINDIIEEPSPIKEVTPLKQKLMNTTDGKENSKSNTPLKTSKGNLHGDGMMSLLVGLISEIKAQNDSIL